jgi:hypothetical protein
LHGLKAETAGVTPAHAGSRQLRARLLGPHLARVLFLPQALERGVPEMAVPRPGGELDHGNEDRLDPAGIARLGPRHVDEW